MDSILTVITPAASQDLTVLAAVKAELDIAADDTENDGLLATCITWASGACADYCNRVFGQETLSEQFRIGSRHDRRGYPGTLSLSRYPVASVTSVTENDVVLAAGDDGYEIDATSGMIRRLSGGWPSCWATGKIVIVYIAGYLLLDSLPQAIERACIELTKSYWYARSRDPTLKSREQHPSLGTETYWVGGPPMSGSLPQEIAGMLQNYRALSFA